MEKDINTGLPFLTPKDLIVTNEKFMLLDCRFKYEYNAGHINGAIRVDSPLKMVDFFFNQIRGNLILVFYCEFSQKRGPSMASYFREYDRKLNLPQYPSLCYPNVFILKGGFKNIWQNNRSLCIGYYLPMIDCPQESQKSMHNFDLYFDKKKKNAQSLKVLKFKSTSEDFFLHLI
jgi:rhodanese-related sulfurtransferase